MSADPSRVRALSIAGTDPTGGAGIQADLKSFAAHGAYGMAVVTALVAQNTCGVRAVHVPDVEFLRAQLDAVSDDVAIDAVKIGMLATARVAGVVEGWLREHRPPVVVLDPVMVATSGDRLLDDDGIAAVRRLVALADVVTPNVPELAVLVDEPVAVSWAQALDQASRLAQASGAGVLVKGGHLDGPVSPDAWVSAAGRHELTSERIETTATHGTGCSLSAALAALRPQRADWIEAAGDAKAWLTGAIRAGEALRVGAGHGPVDHFHHARQLGAPAFTATAWRVVADLRRACDDVPFVRALADGSLPVGAFEDYLHQDALYLGTYSRVLARASQLAPDRPAQEFFARGAQSCLVVEQQLHRERLARAGRSWRGSASPVTVAYTDHLEAVASRGSYAEVVAAVLPCYWVYADVGTRLLGRVDLDGHPYADWLGTYGDPAFAQLAAQARTLADDAAREAGPAVRDRMLDAFVTSCRHEVAFFDQVEVERPAGFSSAHERVPADVR